MKQNIEEDLLKGDNLEIKIEAIFSEISNERDKKVPIRRGCSNTTCFCTGKCKEIIGYREKLPNEL